MSTTIQIRRGTKSEWQSADPTMAVGELGFETDSGRFKVGNNSTNWNDETYFGAPLAGDTGTMSDNQLIQACLDQDVPFPRGTFTITSALYLERKYGANIVGAGMANTTILWNGSAGGVMLHLHGIVGGLVSGFSLLGNGTAGTSNLILVTSPNDYGSSGITFNNLSMSGADTLIQMATASGEINCSDMDYGAGNIYSHCNSGIKILNTQGVAHRFHGGYAYNLLNLGSCSFFEVVRGGALTVSGLSIAGSDGGTVLHVGTSGGGNNCSPITMTNVRAERMRLVVSESTEGIQINLFGGSQASMTSQADTPSIVISGRTKVLAVGTLLFGAATTSGSTASVVLNDCQLPAGFLHNASVSGSGNTEIFNMTPIVL